MLDNPFVSVLMTCFNREKYLAEAIESVLQSTYLNFELIIVDDKSKDRSVAIARSYEETDKRIKVFINKKNLGDYPNRNKAASYAKGEFLMYVDSDDKINHKGIESCVTTMLKYPNANFGMYHYLGVETVELESANAIRKHLLHKPFLSIGPGGTIIKREFFKTINGYPEKYGPANDMYFNLKACSHSTTVMFPFEFNFYRRHPQQEINNKANYLYNNYSYMKDALKELNLFLSDGEKEWLNKKNNRRFLVNIIRYFFKTYDFKEVKNAVKRSGFSLNDAFTGIFHYD